MVVTEALVMGVVGVIWGREKKKWGGERRGRVIMRKGKGKGNGKGYSKGRGGGNLNQLVITEAGS